MNKIFNYSISNFDLEGGGPGESFFSPSEGVKMSLAFFYFVHVLLSMVMHGTNQVVGRKIFNLILLLNIFGSKLIFVILIEFRLYFGQKISPHPTPFREETTNIAFSGVGGP